MSPHPRVHNAFCATRALGIPDEEVKPVLKNLLKMYDEKWDLIEDDNYRTLIDAYFEQKENEGAEGKRPGSLENDGSERHRRKLHTGKPEDEISLEFSNSSHELQADQGDISLTTSRLGIKNSSQPCRAGSSSQLYRTQLNDKKQYFNSFGTAARKRKLDLIGVSSSENPKDPNLIRKDKMPCNHLKGLIKPKTEEAIDVVPLDTEPVSVMHPGVSKVSSGNSSRNSPASQSLALHENDGTLASSTSGEVKIVLNCDSAFEQLNFQVPNLDAVIKVVEDKYLRSYKIVGPQFSVMKLLKDLCESYLKVGVKSYCKSVIISSPEAGDFQDSLHVIGPNERSSTASISQRGLIKKGLGCSGNTSSPSIAVSQQQQTTCDKKRSSRKLHDITKGSEKVKILLVDETGNASLPKFNYIPNNIIYQNAIINISLARISDEDCCMSCSEDCLSSNFPCACARETRGEFAYTLQGLLKDEFLNACVSMRHEPQERHFVYCQDCPIERSKNEYKPEKCKGHMIRKFIKECWRKCGCDMKCGNRVVQRGITCKLQVFLTSEGKDWGVRTLEDLPKGTFVCEYVGEILTNTELFDRNIMMQSGGSEKHTYPVTLDADWGSEIGLKDEEALCLDATFNGNVARFINHRCSDANLVDIPVEVETPDRHYYHLAFFTTRKVNAREELTWDYGIDFADQNHPIKAFRCRCGSTFCRDVKRKGIVRATSKLLKYIEG